MTGEVWSFLETRATGLHRTATGMAAEAARLASLLDQNPCGVIVGACDHALFDRFRSLGLRKLYMVSTDPPSTVAEACARAIQQLASARHPLVILFGATAFGSEVAARVSAATGSGLISHCVDFTREDDVLVARKMAHEGRAHVVLTWSAPPPYVATVEPEVLEAVENKTPSMEVVEETIRIAPLRTELLRRWKVDPRKLDLSEASFVIGVGRPVIARAEQLGTLCEKAERIGAVFGASRPVVDAGLLAREKQIGASGRWLGADVYIACGISGSSYHMMGVRKVRHLVAVNTDRNAPIFKSAELGIIGDLFEVLPALEKMAEAPPAEPGSN
jgi:electron transfer flavoprotein alpha subunit